MEKWTDIHSKIMEKKHTNSAHNKFSGLNFVR